MHKRQQTAKSSRNKGEDDGACWPEVLLCDINPKQGSTRVQRCGLLNQTATFKRCRYRMDPRSNTTHQRRAGQQSCSRCFSTKMADVHGWRSKGKHTDFSLQSGTCGIRERTKSAVRIPAQTTTRFSANNRWRSSTAYARSGHTAICSLARKNRVRCWCR